MGFLKQYTERQSIRTPIDYAASQDANDLNEAVGTKQSTAVLKKQTPYSTVMRDMNYDETTIDEVGRLANVMTAHGVKLVIAPGSASRTPFDAIVNHMTGSGSIGSQHIPNAQGVPHAIDFGERADEGKGMRQGPPSQEFIDVINANTGGPADYFLRGNTVKKGDIGHLEENRGSVTGFSDTSVVRKFAKDNGLNMRTVRQLKGKFRKQKRNARGKLVWVADRCSAKQCLDAMINGASAHKINSAINIGVIYPQCKTGGR